MRSEDDDILSKPGAKATLYDPACGTGGMLSVAEDFVRSHNPQATLTVYGQELNSESYAICRSDIMLKGQSASNSRSATPSSSTTRRIRATSAISTRTSGSTTCSPRCSTRSPSSPTGVLDRQLQETIYQFEHTHGVVEKIDQDSKQLADALAGERARIVITAIQKFPFVMRHVEKLKNRRYAVIMDEAYSSQTGDSAKEMKKVLGGGIDGRRGARPGA